MNPKKDSQGLSTLATDTVSNPPPADKQETATPSDKLDAMVAEAKEEN